MSGAPAAGVRARPHCLRIARTVAHPGRALGSANRKCRRRSRHSSAVRRPSGGGETIAMSPIHSSAVEGAGDESNHAVRPVAASIFSLVGDERIHAIGIARADGSLRFLPSQAPVTTRTPGQAKAARRGPQNSEAARRGRRRPSMYGTPRPATSTVLASRPSQLGSGIGGSGPATPAISAKYVRTRPIPSRS
jgi:hypothetical protein